MKTVDDKIIEVIYAFDEWLAIQVLKRELKHEDLPKLNDAFRDYFSGTRTARKNEV